MRGRAPGREIAGLIAGFGIWSIAFVLLYGVHGWTCADGVAGGRSVLWISWIVMLGAHLALIAWFLRRWRRAPDGLRFLRAASLVLAVGALGATAWTGLPVAVLETC